MNTRNFRVAVLILLSLLSINTHSQTVNILQDNFTGSSASLSWTALNGACLTAGNNTGTIPACKGLEYYTNSSQGPQPQIQTGLTNNQDPAGSGALRLTNGCAGGACYYSENGAIISNTSYPTDQGIQVTFTTYTYGGDDSGGHGADGIGFYLINGTQSPTLGSWGGSLGYSCSNVNTPYNGMVGAYLGLGMDEYGNFLNQSDNTDSGYGYQPGRIGLRGYGNIAWFWLNNTYSKNPENSNKPYYPSSLSSTNQQTAVQDTCETGYLYNFSNASSPKETSTAVADYAAIPNAYLVLPSSTPLADESATTRANATPVSYKLTINPNDLLSLSYSYNGGNYVPVLTNQSITASNGPLPGSFAFGFGGSTGGSDNVHEITCFQVTPANLAASSASLNVQQTGEIQTSTQVYLAYYTTDNWWGQLTSQNLLVNSTTGAASINPVANWDGSCVLTGGTCQSTGVSGMSAQTSRNLLSWNGTNGITLSWSNLSSTEQGWLNSGDNEGQNRLAYLSGDRSNEINSSGSGLFRARTSVLGDIIDSSPVWVGPPTSPYSNAWSDNLYPASSMAENATGAQTYGQFANAEASRLNVVYDGSNDGFLHGFEAGYYSSGNYVNTDNNGEEVIAYMPQAVLKTIHNTADSNGDLDYSSVHYAHNYFVDATPGTGDLFYNNAWNTWLVSGLGAGGSAIFALNITNPSGFSSTNAAPVIGEWNATTLSCANVANCGNYLGNTYGTPQIRRLHNGEWAILFGNGFNSATGHAGIYIITINSSGSPSTTYFLDTGVGTSAKPDGIAYVTPVDLDGDHITDYVYAGDIYGNVWRFDLTSSSPSNWAASTYGGTGAHPLFTTPNGQPITTQVEILSAPGKTGLPYIMVDFGTGQAIEASASSAEQYATGQQALYGVIDWDMAPWNSLGSQKYKSWAGLSGAPTASSPITLSQMQQQTITGTFAYSSGNITGYRTVSDTPLSSTEFGWYLDLPGYIGVSGVGSGNQTEQAVYNAILQDGTFIVNTVVPPNNSPYTCTINTAQGWTMALNPTTGGALPASFFTLSNGGSDGGSNVGSIVSGIAIGATGSPTIVNSEVNGNQTSYLVNQTVNGIGNVQQVNPQFEDSGGQLTWLEIR